MKLDDDLCVEWESAAGFHYDIFIDEGQLSVEVRGPDKLIVWAGLFNEEAKRFERE